VSIYPNIRSVVLHEIANRHTDKQTDKRRVKYSTKAVSTAHSFSLHC